MTKEDIKKALETCSKDEDCDKCPYCNHYYCDRALLKDALVLITKQEKEIKRLNDENCELTKKLEARLACDFVRTAQKHAVQEFVDELRNKCSEVKGYHYSFGNISGVIEELLEEYKK